MQYMFLIYSAEGSGPQAETPGFDAFMAGYGAFTSEVKEAGKMKEDAPLQGVETATTIRMRGGKPEVTDGPFAETKEVLGGYYVLNCDNLDEAMSLAGKIRSAAFGSIEIRPVLDM